MSVIEMVGGPVRASDGQPDAMLAGVWFKARVVAQRIGGIALTAILSGCATMRADVTIRARPEHVWCILGDLESYPAWNPFFVRAKGRLQAGETLDLVMKPAGKSEQTFHPKVLEVRPAESLRWRGRLFVPLLFDGTHQIRIEVLNAGWVRFSQYEEFSGIFVPFVGFEPYRAGWASMNQAVKQRAEALESETENPATAIPGRGRGGCGR